MQRSLWHPLVRVRVSSRLPAQELIDPASSTDESGRTSSNPFGGRLKQLVRMRYKGLNLEQNVCAQLLLPSVRGATSTACRHGEPTVCCIARVTGSRL